MEARVPVCSQLGSPLWPLTISFSRLDSNSSSISIGPSAIRALPCGEPAYRGLIEVKRRVEEARRKIAAQVQRSEAYLAEAQKLSRSGSWASAADGLEQPTGRRRCSGSWAFLLGEAPFCGGVCRVVSPEAWARLAEIFEAARLNKRPLTANFP